jgi:hypothetical protein
LLRETRVTAGEMKEDTRNAKAIDAIQVEQTYTARWGAGPADHKRFRTDANAKYVSAGR